MVVAGMGHHGDATSADPLGIADGGLGEPDTEVR
jgi:hypothetical protein